MSQESTNPVLKWFLIAVSGIVLLGSLPFIWLAILPNDLHAARKLQSRGFVVHNDWYDDTIWQLPAEVCGWDMDITLEDSELICQLTRLRGLFFLYGDMSGLNLDNIGNCQELRFFRFTDATQFPANEIRKLAATPVRDIDLSNTGLKDSDLEAFVGFTQLETLVLYSNVGITDASFEYFEKISSLKNLRLTLTSVTKEGIEEFQKKRPDVDVKVYFE